MASLDTDLFVSTADSGVYVSHNYGGNWTPANQGLPHIDGGQIYGSSLGPVVSIVGTDHDLYAATDTGVYLSTNSGESWASISQFATSALTVRDSFLFACGNGFWMTSNEGESWTELESSNGLEAMYIDGPYIYLGGVDTFLRSSDNGLTWQSTSRFDTSILEPTSKIGPIIGIGDTLFVNIYNASYQDAPDGLYRSLDHGKTWSRCFDEANALLNIGTKIIAFGPGDTYISEDGGTSWTDHPSDLIYGRCITTIGKLLFGGTAEDGVFKSSDSGASWHQVSTGLPKEHTAVFAIGSELVAPGIHRNFASSDDGVSWNITHVFDSSRESDVEMVIPVGDSSFFVSSGDWGIYLTTNRGLSWSYRPSLIERASSMVFLSGWLFDVSEFEVFGSTDSGATWKAIRPGISGNSSTVTITLAVMGNKLLAGTDSGIYVSTDLGTTWQESDSGFPCTLFRYGQYQKNEVVSFAITDSGIFAGTGFTGVYRSTDSGATWFRTTPILADTEDALVYSAGEYIFVLASDTSGRDFYFSPDQGKSWASIGTGIMITSFMSAPVISDGFLFIGNGHGIWRCPLSDFGISAVNEQPQPNAVTIRAFPNPVSGSTNIAFTTESAGYASVSIVNALGTEVARLFSGELAAGEHQFSWDAAKNPCPAGMYECVVRSNGRVEKAGIVVLN